jgi:hypothetical protein
MDGLVEGRIVHFVMPSGEHRPAIIVRVWRDLSGAPEGYSNLVVFVDGANDLHYASRPDVPDQVTLWETSIHYSENKEPRTWHWIEKA